MAKQPKSRARAGSERAASHQHLLDADEIEALRVWAYSTIHDRRAALTVALLGTGGRRFEVAALRCKDISRGPGGPQVFFPEIKGGGNRTTPISEATFRALEHWMIDGRSGNSPLIPTERGEFMSTTTVWREFKDALVVVGIKKAVGVHASRHAAGFLLLKATGDLTKVQHFLGHKSLATTASWYAHIHAPDLRAGLAKAGI